MIIFHDARCLEYSMPGHPERPTRIARTVPLLKDRHPDWEWRKPEAASEAALLRAHSGDHLVRIKGAAHDFDADTPAYPSIYEHALRSAGAAIDAARAALRGERAFSLMPPPSALRFGILTRITATGPRRLSRTTHRSPSHPFINSQHILEQAQNLSRTSITTRWLPSLRAMNMLMLQSMHWKI